MEIVYNPTETAIKSLSESVNSQLIKFQSKN